MSLIALTREVSDSIVRCELTHLARAPIDVARARRQHKAYEVMLAVIGCEIVRLPPEHGLPDAVFVEDVAVALDELAVVARPGAPSRRAETRSVTPALENHRSVVTITEPGTLDGGDVLAVERVLYVGLSTRTNREGVEQLRAAVEPHGYHVAPVPVRGCLHLKSAISRVETRTLLVNRDWVDADAFAGLDLIDVHPDEPFGANALLVGQAVVYPAEFPRTHDRLALHGFDVREVEMSEFAKAEGGVTCCSVILKD
jgi:dimethylargininase